MNARVPMLSAAFITSWISASVSVMKLLMATTGRHAELVHVLDVALEVVAALGDGGDVLVLEIVLGHAAVHLERAHRRDDDGRRRRRPALRHLMSKNFSAPRSAPKPASVTT